MKITVILSASNRCTRLARAPEGVAARILHAASLNWEVIVVDNNYIDQMRAVAGDFCRRYLNRFATCSNNNRACRALATLVSGLHRQT
jgi:hypothetical protein